MGLLMDVECIVDECSDDRLAKDILDRCPNATLRVVVSGTSGIFWDHDVEVLDERGDEWDWLVTTLAYKFSVSGKAKVIMGFIEKGSLTRDAHKITAIVE